MADRRIVVEHEDGRRVSVDEDAFAEASANPFNQGSDVHDFDANTGETIIRRRAARPADRHLSLEAEGFRPVAAIHGDAHDEHCLDGCDVQPGHEVALRKGER